MVCDRYLILDPILISSISFRVAATTHDHDCQNYQYRHCNIISPTLWLLLFWLLLILIVIGDISSLQRDCFSKRWLLPDNYQHLRRNNNDNNKNIFGQSSTTQERDANVKQVSKIKTEDGWIGFSNLNSSTSAHTEIVR